MLAPVMAALMAAAPAPASAQPAAATTLVICLAERDGSLNTCRVKGLLRVCVPVLLAPRPGAKPDPCQPQGRVLPAERVRQ